MQEAKRREKEEQRRICEEEKQRRREEKELRKQEKEKVCASQDQEPSVHQQSLAGDADVGNMIGRNERN